MRLTRIIINDKIFKLNGVTILSNTTSSVLGSFVLFYEDLGPKPSIRIKRPRKI